MKQAMRAAILILGCLAAPVGAREDRAGLPGALAELSDREAVHHLLLAYGATLDARDFVGFAALFTDDAEYVTGPLTSRGGAAIAAALQRNFAVNAFGFTEPNYHLFFNEAIDIQGDRATARSMSLFMVPDAMGRPQAALMAGYEDMLVRRDGRWQFARRVVKSAMAPKLP